MANKWFSSYLTGRSLKVKVPVGGSRTVYSPKYQITYGTAQGSCLGPLLFIIYCNDMHLLPTFGHLILFADDTMLLNSSPNLSFLQYMMTHNMSILIDWFKANQLSLNIGKTNIMIFWPKHQSLDINIKGERIPQVQHVKFLGVTIDDELNWEKQINHVQE